MIPWVTESPPSRASALPTATTWSPTCSASELPSFTVGRFLPSTLSTARSYSGARPSSFAACFVPSLNATSIRPLASATTWLLVTMTPSGEITKPVPSPPLDPPESPEKSPESTAAPVWTVTTAPLTFARTACTSLALPITDVLLTGFDAVPPTTPVRVVLVVSSFVASATPAAVPPPTRAPTTTPTTNWRQPGPREPPSAAGVADGSGDCGGGGGGRDDETAGAAGAAAPPP